MMQSVHLQGIGEHPAIPAKEIKVGTVLVWNYGYTSEVMDFQFSKSGKTLNLKLETPDGRIWDRKLRADRLVAVRMVDSREGGWG